MILQKPFLHNQFIGKIGENYAARHLQKEGHTILRRNYRNKLGEIDIITFDKHKTLCFFEVKTTVNRKGSKETSLPNNYRGEDNLSLKKIGCMMRCAQIYVDSLPIDGPYWEAHGVIINLSKNLTCQEIEIINHINIEVS